MTVTNFGELGLSARLVTVLKKLELVEPTDIQTQAIPPALAGRDILASAETGSGKTAAFLLPIIERIEKSESARALILAPTRELAMQIEDNARRYGRAARIRTVAVVGGESAVKQIRALRSGVDILIATPGRLNDLIERGDAKLADYSILVLDEADRMLDMGFLPQVRRIIRHLPRQRQTMMLSATVSRPVELLARELLHDGVRVDVTTPISTVATLTQKAFPVSAHSKTPLLLALLKQHTDGVFLVFMQTRRGADRLAQILKANRCEAATLHSDRTQSQRNAALASLRSGRVRVLVATDLAARGIDVDNISYVVNYEVPAAAEDYVHRVGRTARAGRLGSAFTLVSPDEEGMLTAIERFTGVKFERSRVPGFSDGRTEEQMRLSSEIARLRAITTRSYRPSRASR